VKICVLSPLLGTVDVEHMSCVEKIPLYITRIRFSSNLLDQSRSALVAMAESTAADVYVWIDSDILFMPRDVEALASKVTDEYPIVSALYSTKDSRNNIIGFTAPGEAPGNLRPASRLGFGFLATHASVFDKIGETLPSVSLQSAMGIISKPYFMSIIDGGKYLAEDFSFCLRAERAGIKMAFAHDVRVIHKGPKHYDIGDHSHYVQAP